MTPSLPFFSIIVPTYARLRQLTACMQALANLDYPRDRFEVIVVDDGSETPPEAAVLSFRNRLDVTLVQQAHAGPAVARNTGAALIALAVGRYYIRPTLFGRSLFPVRQLWGYAVPLCLSTLSLGLYNKLDLFALKALGGTVEQAGIYGAAQGLSLLPNIFALAFSPLLLSTLSRVLHAGDTNLARELSRHALRAAVIRLPFAGLAAGAAPDIAEVLFGPAFVPAAPPMALLIFAAVALVIVSVVTAILTAAGKPGWTFALTGPPVPLALAGHLLLIPKLAAMVPLW